MTPSSRYPLLYRCQIDIIDKELLKDEYMLTKSAGNFKQCEFLKKMDDEENNNLQNEINKVRDHYILSTGEASVSTAVSSPLGLGVGLAIGLLNLPLGILAGVCTLWAGTAGTSEAFRTAKVREIVKVINDDRLVRMNEKIRLISNRIVNKNKLEKEEREQLECAKTYLETRRDNFLRNINVRVKVS